MTLLLTLLVLAAVAAVAAVATGRITGGLDDPVSSLPARPLPPGEVEAADVEHIFDVLIIPTKYDIKFPLT